MRIRALIFSLLIASLCGCATSSIFLPEDPIDAELHRIEKLPNIDEFGMDENGLTSGGCTFFFPKEKPEACLTTWRSKDPLSRLTYLQSNGSTVARSLQQMQMRNIFRTGIVENNPQIGEAEISKVLEEMGSGNIAIDCISKAETTPDLHPDVCILFFGRLASSDEIHTVTEHLLRRQDTEEVPHDSFDRHAALRALRNSENFLLRQHMNRIPQRPMLFERQLRLRNLR